MTDDPNKNDDRDSHVHTARPVRDGGHAMKRPQFLRTMRRSQILRYAIVFVAGLLLGSCQRYTVSTSGDKGRAVLLDTWTGRAWFRLSGGGAGVWSRIRS